MRERRRDRRVTLRKPVLAAVNAAPVFVLDVSTGGLRVAHRSQLPPPGAVCSVDLPSENGNSIRLDCAIVHTAIQQANSAAEKLFQTGLRIVTTDAIARDRAVKRLIRHDSDGVMSRK
ncbi:MAG TPA: PilZ domain-containing protein [Thermoanaerobaculia bacterium]